MKPVCLMAAVASFSLITSGAFGQHGANVRKHTPPPRPSQRDSRAMHGNLADRRDDPVPQEQEPYMLRPGVYVYPAPYRPDYWSPTVRPYYDYSQHRQRLDSRRTVHGRSYQGRGYYRDPYNYQGYPYGCYPPFGGDVYAAYEQGRYDADHEYVWYIAAQRAGRLLNQYQELFDEALVMFRDGHYDWAAIKLLGAAEKDHASAASRLHAGHALFALGRYREAAQLVARAFELSPSLIAKRYDIRDEYGDKDDFERHLAALVAHVGKHPDDADALTLLGYVTFYSEGPGSAYPYLEKAARLDPRSYFIPKLLPLASAARGMEPENGGRPETPPAKTTGTRARKTQPPSLLDQNVVRQVKAG